MIKAEFADNYLVLYINKVLAQSREIQGTIQWYTVACIVQ